MSKGKFKSTISALKSKVTDNESCVTKSMKSENKVKKT